VGARTGTIKDEVDLGEEPVVEDLRLGLVATVDWGVSGIACSS